MTPSVRWGSFHKDCFVKNRLEAELSQTTRCPTMYFQPNTGNTEILSRKYMKYRITENKKNGFTTISLSGKDSGWSRAKQPNNRQCIFHQIQEADIFTEIYVMLKCHFPRTKKEMYTDYINRPLNWTLVQPYDNITIRQARLFHG